jgi:hypothetical protein
MLVFGGPGCHFQQFVKFLKVSQLSKVLLVSLSHLFGVVLLHLFLLPE